MADTQHSVELLPVLSLLGAAVIAGPIFKRLGFGSVLGYLVAGIVVGPFGLRVLTNPTTILNVAELGVVLFLFVIGLEMRPTRLWGLRNQIFGLGLVQFLCCTVALTAISMVAGSEWIPAFIAGTGFVLTSTSIVIQVLEERHEISSPPGQRTVSILLLEDLCIVPLLAVVGFAIYQIARAFGSGGREAFDRSIVMAQGGEFAFVLYGAAAAGGLIDAKQSAEMTAAVIISMMLTPVVILVTTRLRQALRPKTPEREKPDGLTSSVLIIGFGRVGQIASQLLLSRGHTISIIDIDVEMIDVAREFDFRVYYGDGTRLDVLHAAGAPRARAVLVCVDNAESATRIVELVKSEFKGVAVIARSIDRRHSLDLIRAGADFHVRETFESAVLLGGRALQALGASDEEVATITSRVRDRDNLRLQREFVGGRGAGKAFFSGRSTVAQETQNGAGP